LRVGLLFRSGEVSLAELLLRLQASGFRMSPSDAAVLMAGLDANGDGAITYGEFTRALKGQTERVQAHALAQRLGGDVDAIHAKIKRDAQAARGGKAGWARAAQLGWGDADGDGAVTGDDFYASKQVSPALKSVWRKVEQYVDARHREPDHARLRDMFQEFDRSGDGVLAYDELDGALRAVGVHLSPQELVLLCADLDGDGDGAIAYAEFAHQVLAHHTTKLTSASGAKLNAVKELL
jgi:Ca2+-binding EF-hand superfamily protein